MVHHGFRQTSESVSYTHLKREEVAADTEDGQAGAADDVPAPPAGTPQDNEDDLPF